MPDELEVASRWADQDPLVGTTLAQRFELLSVAGQGETGVVYEARDLKTKEILAVKMLRPELVDSRTALAKFSEAARSLSGLCHPHIVTIHDFGVSPEGVPYLVMDYLKGLSLADLLRAEGRQLPERALGILMQVCQALSYAHARGVIHGDLKPANIILALDEEEREQVKIVDFGMTLLAPEENDDLPQAARLRGFGCRLYMSPEQALGKSLDARSDVYSLGCVMYETLTGRPLSSSEFTFNFLETSVRLAPAPCSLVAADDTFPTGLDATVLKALQEDPSERYQSMPALLDDLKPMLSGAKTQILKAVPVPQSNVKARIDFMLSLLLLSICVGMTIYVANCIAQSMRPSESGAPLATPGTPSTAPTSLEEVKKWKERHMRGRN